MIKFPSINQFRNVVKQVQHTSRFIGSDENGNAVYDINKEIKTLNFLGTVKLHGTNAAVVYDVATKEFQFQSRERVLNLQQDNAGFMLNMLSKTEIFEECLTGLINIPNLPKPDTIAVYGEWCGGSIQKGVAISGLEKMFVIFAIKMVYGSASIWVPAELFRVFHFPEHNIYDVTTFPTFKVSIDFNNPELVQNTLVELTEKVEAECPVGKHFGVSGIGEGIVYRCTDVLWESSDYWFKVKGEKHSASKVKKLASVDVESITALNEFVDNVVTESRLEQGLHNLVNEQLKPFEMSSMGDFIRWINADVIKEEMDTIIANQFDPKKLGKPISDKCRKWYIAKLNAEIFYTI